MSPRNRTPRPHKRKGYWYLARRVPKAFAAHDRRGLVFLGTGIRVADNPRGHAAAEAVVKLDAGLARYWRDLKAGRDVQAEQRYQKAVETARTMGLEYHPVAQVAQMPVAEVVRRVELFDDGARAENGAEIAAALGGEHRPQLMLSEMREVYEGIIATELRGKSERQLKKWRTLRDSSAEVFMEVLGGDRSVASLTRADAMALRSHWEGRIPLDEVEIDTANKNIGRVAGMVRVINEAKTLGLPGIFERMSIRGGKQKQRVAYAAAFVQAKFLGDGIFDELNPEARRIVYLVTETSLRLSEACNLSRVTIELDAAVPHVQVRPDGREMKTDHSRRAIPLVGVALMAMHKQPDGFPPLPRQGRQSVGARQQGAGRARPAPGAGAKSLFAAPYLRGSAHRRRSPGEGRGGADGPQVASPALRLGPVARTETRVAQAYCLPSANLGVSVQNAFGAPYGVIPPGGLHLPLQTLEDGRVDGPMA